MNIFEFHIFFDFRLYYYIFLGVITMRFNQMILCRLLCNRRDRLDADTQTLLRENFSGNLYLNLLEY